MQRAQTARGFVTSDYGQALALRERRKSSGPGPFQETPPGLPWTGFWTAVAAV